MLISFLSHFGRFVPVWIRNYSPMNIHPTITNSIAIDGFPLICFVKGWRRLFLSFLCKELKIVKILNSMSSKNKIFPRGQFPTTTEVTFLTVIISTKYFRTEMSPYMNHFTIVLVGFWYRWIIKSDRGKVQSCRNPENLSCLNPVVCYVDMAKRHCSSKVAVWIFWIPSEPDLISIRLYIVCGNKHNSK